MIIFFVDFPSAICLLLPRAINEWASSSPNTYNKLFILFYHHQQNFPFSRGHKKLQSFCKKDANKILVIHSYPGAPEQKHQCTAWNCCCCIQFLRLFACFAPPQMPMPPRPHFPLLDGQFSPPKSMPMPITIRRMQSDEEEQYNNQGWPFHSFSAPCPGHFDELYEQHELFYPSIGQCQQQQATGGGNKFVRKNWLI